MGKHLLLVLAMITQLAANGQSYKGLYVDNLAKIIQSSQATDSLLDYAQKNNYTTLSLYDLFPIHQQYNLTSWSGSQVLANFIKKAKNNYGIQEVAAVGENFWFFNTIIHAYNQLHSFSNEKIDAYNLEFEFWNTNPSAAGYYCSSYLAPNNIPCTVQGAYSFYLNELQLIHTLAQADGCITETYLGWPDSEQAVAIIPYVDRVFVHAYVTNPSSAFGYTLTRLEDFGSTDHTIEIIPLFSSEQNFLGPWLANNAEAGVFTQYMTAYNNASGNWKSRINISGYQWFKYTTMPYTWPVQFALQQKVSTGISGLHTDAIHIGTGNGVVNIFAEQPQPAVVQVYDLSGRVLQKNDVRLNGETKLPLAHNIPGIYVMTITDVAGKLLYRDKIVVQ